MNPKQRKCDITMVLEAGDYCGQKGYLEIGSAQYPFRTSDGMGQFYGQLLHVLCGLLGIRRTNLDGHGRVKFSDDPDEYGNERRRCIGYVDWDDLGKRITWALTRDITQNPARYTDFTLQLHIGGSYDAQPYDETFEFSARDFCYAVCRCGTEILREYGICGYPTVADTVEDINLREFLLLKAFALQVEEEFGFTPSSSRRSNLSKELELLAMPM